MNEGWGGGMPKRFHASDAVAQMMREAQRPEILHERDFLAEGWDDVGDGGSSGIGDGSTRV